MYMFLNDQKNLKNIFCSTTYSVKQHIMFNSIFYHTTHMAGTTYVYQQHKYVYQQHTYVIKFYVAYIHCRH